jgi:hypothetical protein
MKLLFPVFLLLAASLTFGEPIDARSFNIQFFQAVQGLEFAGNF